jgi:hypothetical protein
MSECLDVLRELVWGQLTLIAPAAQLLRELAGYLPEKERGFGGGTQLIQQLLRDELLGRLAAINRIKQNVCVNGVHGVVHDSGDHHRS